MNKKELMPGVFVYRPNINLSKIMNEIKNNIDIKNSYSQWGDHEKYFQADISMENPEDKAGATESIQEIKKHYTDIFFDYLFNIKDEKILPPFLDYSGKGFNWVYGDGGLLQIHGAATKQEEEYGLGFHLDVATISTEPGWKNIFTIIFYLNDDYDNGEISFTYNDSFNSTSFPNDYLKILKYKPKAGDALVFPAHFPHAVSRCYKNDRHVFLSTCKYRISENDDISNFLPKDLSVLEEVYETDREIKYINGAEI